MSMKKKIATGALLVAFGATAVTGATLAYFTDTDNATNTFTVGNVQIDLVEKNADGNDFTNDQKLMPGSKTTNNIAKKVTVTNEVGSSPAYMWIEVWVPAALDDGDDNSPTAPGLGNSLHFNYGTTVVETKSTYLGSKEIDGVSYNGYVHYDPNQTPVEAGESTIQLLDQVYMDKKVTQNENGQLILADGKTVYTGDWELVINGVGIQAEGINGVTNAISEYYSKDVTQYLW